MSRPLRALCVFGLLCLSSLAHAFALQQLSDQLARPAVVQGRFIQEKHLRALPQPLISKGRFVLAKDAGLLWLLETPLKQDYRINANGIARREAEG
uniref:outer membrane lipoprotein carrier protein LolA n=4 Tax=Pseudomonas TaxID=286 RepID=UPI0013E07C55